MFPNKLTLELLKDGLYQAYNILSKFNEIKKKREAMSDAQQPFEWTNDLILRYAELYANELAANVIKFKNGNYQAKFTTVEEFKASRSSGVIENKDWEIISLYKDEHTWTCNKDIIDNFITVAHGGWKISQVRRLSDQTIWTVGEIHGATSYRNRKIEEFVISYDNQITVIQVGGETKLADLVKTPTQEPKPAPLFTTEDGKEIFEGDRYWWVWIGNGENAYNVERGFKADSSSGKGGYLNKYFSTEAAAHLYVVMNKPVLSISEVLNIKTVAGTGERALERLKERVKSKLNNTGGDIK